MASRKAIARRRSYSRPRVHRKQKFTLPLAVVAGFVPLAVGVWNRRSSATAIGQYVQGALTGIDPATGSFNLALLRGGTLPIVGGFAVHKIASMLGINRAIARAGIPVIRI